MTQEQKFYEARSGLFLKTFGCQMNVYDSEKIASSLREDYKLVQRVEDASLVFLNTCSVRDKAEHKLYSLLGIVREYKKCNPNVIIGVGGCVAQQEGEAIAKRCPEIDFIVGTHNLSLVPSLVRNARDGIGQQIAVDFRDEWEDLPDDFQTLPRGDVELALEEGMGFSSSIRALIAIQRGCNKMCSFCVVPTTRGKEVSRSLLEVLKEINFKVSAGAREVVLLGQTVNSYGRDLLPRISFADLIRQIAQVSRIERIRFVSPHPQDVRDDLIDLYGSIPQLVPHIHLPLQSGSDRVLRAMNRNYKVKRYLEIVDALRSRCPEIAITTDLIAGFPTETEAEFEETLDVMSRVRFAHSFAFKYSRRPNTKAISVYTLEDEVSEECKSSRLERILKLQDQHSMQFNRLKIGQIVDVLIEGANKNKSAFAQSKSVLARGKFVLARGRTPENILVEIEVPDNTTSVTCSTLGFLSESCSNKSVANDDIVACLKPGDLVKVIIKGCGAYGLRGRLVLQSESDL